MKRSFFQAAVVSILLYGCTTWTLTKRLEKKLDGNYTRMLRAILNQSWRQHPTKHHLYGHLPPITKTIQARLTRHAGHCWRSRDELISDVLLCVLYWPTTRPGCQNRKCTYVNNRSIRLRNIRIITVDELNECNCDAHKMKGALNYYITQWRQEVSLKTRWVGDKMQ